MREKRSEEFWFSTKQVKISLFFFSTFSRFVFSSKTLIRRKFLFWKVSICFGWNGCSRDAVQCTTGARWYYFWETSRFWRVSITDRSWRHEKLPSATNWRREKTEREDAISSACGWISGYKTWWCLAPTLNMGESAMMMAGSMRIKPCHLPSVESECTIGPDGWDITFRHKREASHIFLRFSMESRHFSRHF